MDSEFKSEYLALSHQRALKEASAPGDSPVQNFYKGNTVFVTGGSGFLGKLLIEKLLRTCAPRKIYLLLRHKKSKSPKERVIEIIKDPLFEELRKQIKNFEELIYPVHGDVSKLKLGLAECDWENISKEVNVIFHLAANVRFELELKEALLNNARGTREVLHLAGDCTQLRAFVYVSTAYTHATLDRIDGTVSEVFYDVPVPPDTLIKLAETMSNEKLNKIKPTIIDGWPNTYTFSKAIAEEIVRTNNANIPICVVRPAIVIGTYREPIPGWLDMSCAYGPSGLILGTVVGFMHVLYMDISKKSDLVPADIVNNSIIVAAYETANKRNNEGQLPMIYAVSSNRNELRYSTILEIIQSLKKIIAFSKAIWFVKNYKKVDNLALTLSYFTTNQWIIKDDNLHNLYKNQSPTDRKIFDMDIMSVDWHTKIYFWCKGVVKYLHKDEQKSMVYAIRRQKVLRIVHYIVSALYFYLIVKLIKFCFDLFFGFS